MEDFDLLKHSHTCTRVFTPGSMASQDGLYRVAQKVSHYQTIKTVLNRIKACQWDYIYSSD